MSATNPMEEIVIQAENLIANMIPDIEPRVPFKLARPDQHIEDAPLSKGQRESVRRFAVYPSGTIRFGDFRGSCMPIDAGMTVWVRYQIPIVHGGYRRAMQMIGSDKVRIAHDMMWSNNPAWVGSGMQTIDIVTIAEPRMIGATKSNLYLLQMVLSINMNIERNQ